MLHVGAVGDQRVLVEIGDRGPEVFAVLAEDLFAAAQAGLRFAAHVRSRSSLRLVCARAQASTGRAAIQIGWGRLAAPIFLFSRVTEGSGNDRLAARVDARRPRMKIDIRVECHAGYRADEYPLRFILRGRLFEIIEVEDRWYSPGTIYFRVRAEDGNFYVLRHDEGIDVSQRHRAR